MGDFAGPISQQRSSSHPRRRSLISCGSPGIATTCVLVRVAIHSMGLPGATSANRARVSFRFVSDENALSPRPRVDAAGAGACPRRGRVERAGEPRMQRGRWTVCAPGPALVRWRGSSAVAALARLATEAQALRRADGIGARSAPARSLRRARAPRGARACVPISRCTGGPDAAPETESETDADADGAPAGRGGSRPATRPPSMHAGPSAPSPPSTLARWPLGGLHGPMDCAGSPRPCGARPRPLPQPRLASSVFRAPRTP